MGDGLQVNLAHGIRGSTVLNFTVGIPFMGIIGSKGIFTAGKIVGPFKGGMGTWGW